MATRIDETTARPSGPTHAADQPATLPGRGQPQARQVADRIVPFPPLQHLATDWMELERRQHVMHGLIEVDITETRRAIREYRARTGEPLSLTTLLVHCLARAVDEDKAMQAYRLGRRRQVLFADVDVGIMVEREVDGAKVPVGYVIRAANEKNLDQIEREIRAAQQGRLDAIAGNSLPRRLRWLLTPGLAVWLALPAALRRAIWTWALRNPYRRTRLMGTVGLSSVGMFGRGTGWGIAPMNHTLTLVVGGLARKPGVVGGVIAEREYLCLTLTLDHDVVDGAPAARFVRHLTHLIESGAGLQPEEEQR